MLDYEIRGEMLMDLPKPYRMMHILQRAAGYTLAFHSHEDFYHINYITEGWIRIGFEGKEYIVKEGQVVILPPRREHSIEAPDGYTQIGIDMYETKDERGIYDLFCATYPTGFAIVTLLGFPKSFDELYRAFRTLNVLNRLKITNTVEFLVLTTIEYYQHVKSPNFKKRFLDLMAQEHAYSLPLEKMCQHLGVGKTHLERLVKKEFGCGAMEYCNKIKLSKACLLLQSTDLPIKSISESLSFYDPSHFNSFFKARMQLTPNQYRIQSRS